MRPEELLTWREIRRAEIIAHRNPRHVELERLRRRRRIRLALIIAARRTTPC